MGMKKLNAISHETETLLDLARNEKIAISSSIIQCILLSVDTIKYIVANLDTQTRKENISDKKFNEIINSVQKLVIDSQSTTPSQPFQPVQLSQSVQSPSQPVQSSSQPIAEKSRKIKTNQVKVKTEKLDYLIDMVGELVINSNLIREDQNILAINDQIFLTKFAQLNRVVSELQKASTSLRMMPIANTFQKMKRVVRDYTHSTGKKMELVFVGEDTEIDKNIVDSLYDPLVHMIRNSCDHGIEDEETRIASGKNQQGTITLKAYHKGNSINIDVIDDGKGLDKQILYMKGIEKDLFDENENLSDDDIYRIIFHPGFSTCDKITKVSGRGVGMDVVNQAVKSLGGRIDILTEKGKGSTFRMILPLTLAIIDGMLIRVGSELFILPVVSVQRSVQVDGEMINNIVGQGSTLKLQNKLIPIVKIYELFNIENPVTDFTKAILIIVSNGRKRFALMADALVGIQDVVIKSLGEKFVNLDGISGATILGDGRVGLILDINSLENLVNNQEKNQNQRKT